MTGAADEQTSVGQDCWYKARAEMRHRWTLRSAHGIFRPARVWEGTVANRRAQRVLSLDQGRQGRESVVATFAYGHEHRAAVDSEQSRPKSPGITKIGRELIILNFIQLLY